MRQQLIITIFLTIILSIAICLKLAYFPKIYGHTAFYFHSTFWICGILIAILSYNIFLHFITSKKGAPHRPYAFWPNRRETYRIIYPEFVLPTLIIDKIDGTAKRHLEFSIVDLSQDGSCFLDDGCLGEMKNFSGRIRFNNGDSISIEGEFIRKNGNHVSVRFKHAIDWPILLKEQRRIMGQLRPKKRQRV
ncbi:MAG: hypothetical protein PVJ84_16205 [Desulfobacteraceae bacterium]|jgi:hypothetical protein